MLTFLRCLFAAMILYMAYVAIATSLESNLFAVWGELARLPWMVATLKDFYLNILIIYLWVLYKEEGWPARLLWLVGCVCLGSIATSAYVFLELLRLRPG